MERTSRPSQIRRVLSGLQRGRPFDVSDLAAIGVTPQAASYLVKHGALARLGHGTYCLPGEKISAHAATAWLQARIEGLHVGGRSALALHGIRHSIGPRETLVLWADNPFTIPKWFREEHRSRGVGRRLFDWTDETLPRRTVGTPPGVPADLHVSSPERATLELLFEAGRHEALAEARNVFDGLRPPRTKILGPLLACCTSVKAVRLYLTWARETGLVDVDQLAASYPLRVGGQRRWVNRLPDGTLLMLKQYG